MKYKVGDKARVRSDLVVDEAYGGWYFDLRMSGKKGVILTVDDVNSNDYYIMDDGSGYWTDEMLEDVEEEFQLPEKWCVKLTEHSVDIVGRYYNKQANAHNYTTLEGKCYLASHDIYDGKSIMEGNCSPYFRISKPNSKYPEITFDQFKKYVLKESESTPKFESKFVKGRWYKNPKWWSSPEDFCKFSGEFKGDLIGYTDNIIKGIPYFGSTGYWCNGDSCIEASAEEIQQYLPENHPDKIKKRTKKVEDLKYPDAVHCISKEERDLLSKHVPYKVNEWNKNYPYLLIDGGNKSSPYNEAIYPGYVNYEFSDIIFPEEKTVNKEDEEFKIGAYIVFIDYFGSSKKGDVDKIEEVYSPEQIMLEKEGISWGRLGEGFSKRCKYFLTLEEAQRFSDELLGKNKVETKPMLSKEELLAEAKRRYPVGIVFNAARGERGEYTVGSNSVFRYNSDDAICIKDDGNGTVYYRGEWAEITSKPFNSPIAEKEVERLSFYVRYNTSFTEDLYNKLIDWCVKNNSYKTRGWSDTYKGLVENGFFLYDSASLNKLGGHGYGVDNNRQGCINEYSIQQVKELIGYKEVLEHPKYVECIGLEETNVMFWSQKFTVGEIYLVEEDDGTTTFKINGTWCDKSQFKPSTKEAFEKQSKPVAQKKEELVQTGLSQSQACDSCKYNDNCGEKGFFCSAAGGQHYPKDSLSERYIVAVDPFDTESSSSGIEVGRLHLDRGIGLYEQIEAIGRGGCVPSFFGTSGNLPNIKFVGDSDSDEIYVPIIKTEVKQIKL